MKFRQYAAGLPDITSGLFFLFIWINPDFFGAESVFYMTITFGMEFLVVHSYGIFGQIPIQPGDLKAKIKIYIPVALFYSLFGIGFALMAKSVWPLLSFIWLTASKVFAYVADSEKAIASEIIKKRWGAMCGFYLLATFVTLFLPLPEFGVTREIVSAAGFDGRGEWERYPHKALAAGFLYFTLLGVFEIRSSKYIKD